MVEEHVSSVSPDWLVSLLVVSHTQWNQGTYNSLGQASWKKVHKMNYKTLTQNIKTMEN